MLAIIAAASRLEPAVGLARPAGYDGGMARDRFYHRLRVGILLAIVIAWASLLVAVYVFHVPFLPQPDGDDKNFPEQPAKQQNSGD
jgi:hypothetical protein